jgi:hypothetical protein
MTQGSEPAPKDSAQPTDATPWWKKEALLLGLIPALGYMLAYLHELGFSLAYGYPDVLIRVDVDTILLSTTIVVLICWPILWWMKVHEFVEAVNLGEMTVVKRRTVTTLMTAGFLTMTAVFVLLVSIFVVARGWLQVVPLSISIAFVYVVHRRYRATKFTKPLRLLAPLFVFLALTMVFGPTLDMPITKVYPIASVNGIDHVLVRRNGDYWIAGVLDSGRGIGPKFTTLPVVGSAFEIKAVGPLKSKAGLMLPR